MSVKNIKLMIITVITVLLTSCATVSMQALSSSLNSWVGKSANTLIARWGDPDRTLSEPGRTVYVYNRSVDESSAYCKMYFTVKSGVVSKTHYNRQDLGCLIIGPGFLKSLTY